jgi:D-alanyl-D-alanine carboxypeptidase (penicillin-binding protein 5/6)
MSLRITSWVLLCLGTVLQPGIAAVTTPPAPTLPAKAYALIDANSGLELAAQRPDERMEPASLTKIMTAYAVFQELKAGRIHLDDMVTVSAKAWRTPGSRTFIEVNKQVPVEILLQGMIVQSGNDASVALAEYVAGSEEAFAALMNRYAKDLGLTGTHYMNSTGLPDANHYTTARDTAMLTRALIREFPEYYRWYSQKEFTYNGITQHNRNRLLWRDPSVDGVKTGYTEAAGYCLVASAKRDEMRLISVVLGADKVAARFRQSQALLNYGFRFFETHHIYDKEKPVTTVRVWEGEAPELALGVEQDVYITVPRERSGSLAATLDLSNPVIAPIQKGQPLGKLKIALGDEALASFPLVAMQEVGEGGLWRTLVDRVSLWVGQLVSD